MSTKEKKARKQRKRSDYRRRKRAGITLHRLGKESFVWYDDPPRPVNEFDWSTIQDLDSWDAKDAHNG